VAQLAEPMETRACTGTSGASRPIAKAPAGCASCSPEGRRPPEAWVPPKRVRQWRSRARLRHTLIGERPHWMQRIQATLFHHGVSGTPEKLRTRARSRLPGWSADDQHPLALDAGLDEPDRLRLAFAAGAFRDDRSGTVELRFTSEQSARIVDRLEAACAASSTARVCPKGGRNGPCAGSGAAARL
jgi:hypothetical protein